MKRIATLVLGVVTVGVALTGCSAPAVGENEDAPVVAESSAPIVTEEAIVQEGTRETPIPFGGSATVQELGEAGGDAWTVSIAQPYDVSQVILDEAKELFGDDESYLASYRPPEGQIYLGVPLSITRLLDIPEDPFFALTVEFVTSDGRTVQKSNQYSRANPPLMDVGEMYAPATAAATEVFLVPAGTTGQVLLTESNSGARFYFGETP